MIILHGFLAIYFISLVLVIFDLLAGGGRRLMLFSSPKASFDFFGTLMDVLAVAFTQRAGS